MSFDMVAARLNDDYRRILAAVRAHSEQLLGHSPRFKYFTLHGREHIEQLFVILELLLNGGIRLNEEELFILSHAEVVHAKSKGRCKSHRTVSRSAAD
jgi:hypothetical protein